MFSNNRFHPVRRHLGRVGSRPLKNKRNNFHEGKFHETLVLSVNSENADDEVRE